MEKSVADFIAQNLAHLTTNTRIDTPVLVFMVQENVLSPYDKDQIRLEGNDLDKSDRFYSILRTKTTQELLTTLNVFKKTNQSLFVIQKLEEFLGVEPDTMRHVAPPLTNVEAKTENTLNPRENEMLIENIPSGLLSFQNTESVASAVVLKNSTSSLCMHPNKWYYYEATREYFPMPIDIPPFSQRGFGFTHSGGILGLFSFRICDTRFVGRYELWDGYNSLAVAFVPPNCPVDIKLSGGMCGAGGWTKSPEKSKVWVEHWKNNGKIEKLEARLQFGSICAEATMTIGPKTIVNVEIKTVVVIPPKKKKGLRIF